MKHINFANNYSEGRINTVSEIADAGPYRRPKANIETAQQTLESANLDSHHPSRRQMAMTVMSIYLIMFCASTGMSWAQVVDLSWAGNFEIDATNQGFRTIKWRAGGKLVSFELPVEALPTFRRFLEVRTYLLRKSDFKFLFFSMDTIDVKTVRQRTGSLQSIYETLRRIDPSLPRLLPRQWRAAKSHWLIQNTDVSTAALVLQNTERTMLQSYAEGSEIQQAKEIGRFLQQMAKTVMSTSEIAPNETPRTVGKCVSYGAPKIIEGLETIKPDCKGVEGCLGCEKFRLHPDEQDTRKLLSCRYCLRRSSLFLENHEHQQKILQPILDRIDVILSELSAHDGVMVERVTHEVDVDGELDPYWQGKLLMLMELGIIQ